MQSTTNIVTCEVDRTDRRIPGSLVPTRRQCDILHCSCDIALIPAICQFRSLTVERLWLTQTSYRIAPRERVKEYLEDRWLPETRCLPLCSAHFCRSRCDSGMCLCAMDPCKRLPTLPFQTTTQEMYPTFRNCRRLAICAPLFSLEPAIIHTPSCFLSLWKLTCQ